jgi:hypothetical protein
VLLGGLCVLYVACAGLLGLAALGCAPLAPGADPIAVDAERTIRASFDAVDGFLQYDHANRPTLRQVAPDVHAFAESLRTTLQDPATSPFEAAWAAVRAYKAGRTADNGSRVEDAVAVVEQLARRARLYLLRVNPPPE